MITSLRAEFRKLLTVRSTYVILLISFAIASVLIGFWIYGYKDVQHAGADNSALFNSLLASISTVGVFLSFVAVLLVGHEYRYNTIMYSLTSSNSRTKLFFAKWIALAVFALVFTGLIVLLNWILFYVGLSVHHITPIAQNVPMGDFLRRSIPTILGDISFAFIIAMLLRNLIGAIAVVLILPTTIETLLTLVLHDNTKYLPYTALGNLTTISTTMSGKIDFMLSFWVVVAYTVVGGLVACLLFLKRDAN